MVRAFHVAGLLVLLPFGLASPSFAGMNQDLTDCTASDKSTSADACTRVLDSGRLPTEQHYIAYYNRAWSHFNAGESSDAVADFDLSLKRNPDYADTYYSRAIVHHERGERAEALSDVDSYVEKKSSDWQAYFNRALLMRRMGELDRAKADAEKAASLKPAERKITVLEALILSDKEDNAAARVKADQAINDAPDNASGYYARGLISFRENKLDPAAKDVEKAISVKDAFPAAHTLLGRIAEAKGDNGSASKHYRRSLDIPAKSVDARAAHDEARERLDALPGEKSDRVALSNAAASTTGGCRKFIPAVSITVAVECDK